MDWPMGVALNPVTSAGWHDAQGSAPQADSTAIRASAAKGKQAFRNDSNPGDMDAQVILRRRPARGQHDRLASAVSETAGRYFLRGPLMGWVDFGMESYPTAGHRCLTPGT